MFKNVLVGVDGSDNSRDAIALARRLADADADLVLAHVRRGELAPLKTVQRTLLKEDREASTELLEHERVTADITAELLSVVGLSVASGLHRQAERQGADLLVVGSCRHGALGRAMLGDHARASLNGASCTVAIAARGYAETSGEITSIGVAYNASAESEAALEAARILAALTGASVQLREVLFSPRWTPAFDVGPTGEQTLNEADDRIQAIPGVAGKAVYGSAEEELDAFSDEVDLLLVGSRGYGPLKRLMLGSTSNHLAGHAGCCLLVLPRLATERDEPARDLHADHSHAVSQLA